MWTFILSHQPLKAIYLTYVFVSFLFVKLPWWMVVFLVPAFRPRPSWPYARALFVKASNVVFVAAFNTASLGLFRRDPRTLAKEADKVGLVFIDAAPELVVGDVKKYAEVNRVSPAQIAGYWYEKWDPETKFAGQSARWDRAAGPDEKVVLSFHSGGWVIGDASPKGVNGLLPAEMAQYLPGFSRVLSVEYRLSQGPPLRIENPFPAALMDATAAYAYLVRDLGFKPANILLAGESAGGNLAVALARFLVASRDALPAALAPPGGLFLMSPTGDWSTSHAAGSMQRNAGVDWVRGFVEGYCSAALCGHLGRGEADTNAWISPASRNLPVVEGLFKGLPRTLIQVGGAEMMLDQVRTLKDRMKKDMGEHMVEYVEVKDGTHILLALPWHEEEKTKVYKQVREWVADVFS